MNQCPRREDGAAPPRRTVRVVAYYLPQFHPIPENDAWWGKGFTEWTNVAKAKPLFRGHRQPHLPADLGYYDLRLPDVREAQAELARAYGIEAFCYWHYWFLGKQLLDRPLREVLQSGRPDFPFCVGWANESWTRRWTGEEAEVLLEQQYSDADDEAHARWLLPVFADARYLRIDGRPVFVVYRPPSLPNPRRTLDRVREACVRAGLPEPYVIGRDMHNAGVDMRQHGCDITESSAPDLGALPGFYDEPGTPAVWKRNIQLGVWSGSIKAYDYEDACAVMERLRPAHPFLPGCFVAWDNTPRRGDRAIVLTGSTPEAFGRAFGRAAAVVAGFDPEHRLVFVNAWNEWAEGMYLEPNQRDGHDYLRAIRQSLAGLG